MTASRTLLCCTIFASILFTGCAKKESSNPVGLSGLEPNPTPDPVPGGPISGVQRKQVMTTMKTFMDSVVNVNPSGKTSALLKFFKSRPEIQLAGISSDSSVYGIFTDGVMMLYSDNLEYDPAAAVPPLLPLDSPTGRSSGKTYSTLPGSTDAYLMDIQTPQSDQTYIARSIRWLNRLLLVSTTRAGYAPHPLNSTVDNLKHVNNAGLFHISTHGGLAPAKYADVEVYSLMSAEQWDDGKDTTDYKIDLMEQRLTLFWTDTPPDANGRTGLVCNYGFTGAFVKKYMTFSTNSLVVISACTSFDPGMLSAFSQAGASVYFGWDKPVLANVCDAAGGFIIDRSLGTSLLSPVPTPPQRPFNWELVFYDLDFRGADVSRGKQVARMRYSQLKGDLNVLVPSIQDITFMTRDANQTMRLEGDWGTVPGQVMLNGTPLKLVSPWNERDLETEVPTGGGTVQVVVNGLKSNAVQLTEYSGSITYTEAGEGTLKKRMSLTLKFIVDIHKYRIVSGANAVYKDEALFWYPRAIGLLRGSGGTYEASGKYKRSFTDSTLWSGSGSFALTASLLSAVPTGGGGGGGVVDDEGKAATLSFMGMAPYTITTSGSPTREEFFTPTAVFSEPIYATVGSGYVLKGGTLTAASSGSTYTLEWSDMVPQYLPDPAAAR
jgi:hypothetical protein